MARCPECGFELAELEGWQYDESGWATAGDRIVDAASAVADLLRTTAVGSLRSRPDPGVWSRLEYACHLRDVLLVQRERVLQARRGHGDETQPMGRDERVEHDGYNEQDPGDVAVQVEQAARLFTGVLDRLGDQDWDLTMAYNFPQPTTRRLRWVAVHTAHEAVHHLHDMRGQG